MNVAWDMTQTLDLHSYLQQSAPLYLHLQMVPPRQPQTRTGELSSEDYIRSQVEWF